MTFDNSRTIISLRIKLFAATVILLAFLALAYLIKYIKFPLLGLGDTIWTILLISIWLLLAFMPMVLNYQYISFSDEGDKIIFRYFTSGIIGGKKNSVEITKVSFTGYKTETSFFGLIQCIILFQNVRQSIAKYPRIYISALTGEEKEKLFNSLNRHGRPL